LRRADAWITIACALLIPISFWTGWIDSVPFISLITAIGLALGSPSACIQPESTRWRLLTLRVCEVVIMVAIDYRRSRVSALHCAWLVGWNLTPFG